MRWHLAGVPRYLALGSGGETPPRQPPGRRRYLRVNVAYKITLIPGDGIGPEVTRATVPFWKPPRGSKLNGKFSVRALRPLRSITNTFLKKSSSRERTHVGLKGPVTTPVGERFPSINVALRKKFELYANFRPIPQPAAFPPAIPTST